MSEQEACPTISQFHPEHKHHERYCKSSSKFRDTQQTTAKAKSKLFVLQDMTIPNAQKGAGIFTYKNVPQQMPQFCRSIFQIFQHHGSHLGWSRSSRLQLSFYPDHKREAHLGRHVQWGHTIQIYVVDIGIWVALIC